MENQNFDDTRILTEPEVLAILSIGRTNLLGGCKTGKYPAPVRIGAKRRGWRASDIHAYLKNLTAA